MFKKIFIYIFVFFPGVVLAETTASVDTDTARQEYAISQCDFEFIRTEHISSDGYKGSEETRGRSVDCAVGLDYEPAPSAEHPFFLYIFSVGAVFRNLGRFDEYHGFKLNQGKIEFIGDRSQYLVDPLKVIQHKLYVYGDGDDKTYVGIQKVRGFLPAGGPVFVQGIRILRISKGFAVLFFYDFEPDFYYINDNPYNLFRKNLIKEMPLFVQGIRYKGAADGDHSK